MGISSKPVLKAEDATLFPSSRGPSGASWHMITHAFPDTSAVHYTSTDGCRSWQRRGNTTWHSLTIHLDGQARQLHKRERPQVVLQQGSLTPLALFTGVQIVGERFPRNAVNLIR